MKTSPLLRSLVLSLTLLTSVPSFAAVKKEFNVCWTIYAGWMPWGAISNEKIIDKWASKYGIKNQYRSAQRLHRIHQPVHRRAV